MTDDNDRDDRNEADEGDDLSRAKAEFVSDVTGKLLHTFYGDNAHMVLVISHPIDPDDPESLHRIRTCFTMSRGDAVTLLDGITRDLCERYGLAPDPLQLEHEKSYEHAQ